MFKKALVKAVRSQIDPMLGDLPLTPVIAEKPIAAPWMVTIRWDCPEKGWADEYTSAGVLVGPRHVLTVAHTFDDRLPVPKDLRHKPTIRERKFFVRIGPSHDGDRRAIAKWTNGAFAPPGVRGAVRIEDRVNDVQIIELDEPTSVEPIPLADVTPKVGEGVSFIGRPKDGVEDLTQIDTVVINRQVGKVAQIGADELVAANVAGDIRIGRGFSGGPVVRLRPSGDPELVGILSRGIADLDDGYPAPAVFVDIAGAQRTFVTDALN